MYTDWLAYKYLKSSKKAGFSLGNLISIFGIALGVFALIVVMSVMNGLEQDVTKRILGLHSEIKIYSRNFQKIKSPDKLIAKVNKLEDVSTSPVLQKELMLMHNKNVTGTVCQGIDLEMHQHVSDLTKNIYLGYPSAADMENGIILGSEIALNLGVNVNDTVELMSPIADQPTPFGLIPKSKGLKVVGLYYTGLPEYDMKYTFTDLETLQDFSDIDNGISFLELKSGSPENAIKIAKKLSKSLGEDYIVKDWREFERHLFSAIKFEKKVMFLVLILIFLVTAFNMIGNYLKLLGEKREQIGILKSLGAKKDEITSIFLKNGLFVGIIGTSAGLISSFIILLAQMKWHFIKIPISGLPFKEIPVQIEFLDVLIVVGVSLLITILTTLIPARAITKITPVSILKKAEE